MEKKDLTVEWKGKRVFQSNASAQWRIVNFLLIVPIDLPDSFHTVHEFPVFRFLLLRAAAASAVVAVGRRRVEARTHCIRLFESQYMWRRGRHRGAWLRWRSRLGSRVIWNAHFGIRSRLSPILRLSPHKTLLLCKCLSNNLFFSFSLRSALGVLVMMMNYWWNSFPSFSTVAFFYSPSLCAGCFVFMVAELLPGDCDLSTTQLRKPSILITMFQSEGERFQLRIHNI